MIKVEERPYQIDAFWFDGKLESALAILQELEDYGAFYSGKVEIKSNTGLMFSVWRNYGDDTKPVLVMSERWIVMEAGGVKTYVDGEFRRRYKEVE